MGYTAKEPLSAGTVGYKGILQGIIGGGGFLAVVAIIRALKPDLIWPADQDAEVTTKINEAIQSLAVAATSIGFVIGAVKNVWKNREKIEGGIVVKKVVPLLLCLSLLGLSGCAITGPNGAWQLSLNAEQIGFVKDLAVEIYNIEQRIDEAQAEAEAAKKEGKIEKVESILERIERMREEIRAKEQKIEEQEQGQE